MSLEQKCLPLPREPEKSIAECDESLKTLEARIESGEIMNVEVINLEIGRVRGRIEEIRDKALKKCPPESDIYIKVSDTFESLLDLLQKESHILYDQLVDRLTLPRTIKPEKTDS